MMINLGNRDYDSYERNEHHYLKYKIAYAFYGPPQQLSEDNNVEEFNFQTSFNLYEPDQKKHIQETYEKIIKHNSKYDSLLNKLMDTIRDYCRFIFKTQGSSSYANNL